MKTHKKKKKEIQHYVKHMIFNELRCEIKHEVIGIKFLHKTHYIQT